MKQKRLTVYETLDEEPNEELDEEYLEATGETTDDENNLTIHNINHDNYDIDHNKGPTIVLLSLCQGRVVFASQISTLPLTGQTPAYQMCNLCLTHLHIKALKRLTL